MPDLHHQFAGWSDDERTWTAKIIRRTALQQPRENRYEKGRRFSGSGLRLAGDIPARKRDREHSLLNGGATFETGRIDTARDWFWNGQGPEVHETNSLFDDAVSPNEFLARVPVPLPTRPLASPQATLRDRCNPPCGDAPDRYSTRRLSWARPSPCDRRQFGSSARRHVSYPP